MALCLGEESTGMPAPALRSWTTYQRTDELLRLEYRCPPH